MGLRRRPHVPYRLLRSSPALILTTLCDSLALFTSYLTDVLMGLMDTVQSSWTSAFGLVSVLHTLSLASSWRGDPAGEEGTRRGRVGNPAGERRSPAGERGPGWGAGQPVSPHCVCLGSVSASRVSYVSAAPDAITLI